MLSPGNNHIRTLALCNSRVVIASPLLFPGKVELMLGDLLTQLVLACKLRKPSLKRQSDERMLVKNFVPGNIDQP